MAKVRNGMKFLAGLLLCGSTTAAYGAPPPTVAQMLQFRPTQAGVEMTTPGEAELAACKVELVQGAKLSSGKTPSGWALKDAQGRMIRRFYDADGDGRIDIWSYYQTGEECYREIDSNLNGKVDQYRWLGPNGTRWGVSANEDGRISSWKQISAEEVSQEIFQAVRLRDYARLQALMINKSDLDALDLPEAEVNRIKGKLMQAPTRFQETTAALIKLSEKARWMHLETGVPQCVAADEIGAKADIIRHKHGTIVIMDGEKSTEYLQTGEMILVGKAWRITEGPVRGNVSTNGSGNAPQGGGLDIPDEVKDEITELQKIDAAGRDAGGDPAKTIRYNLARAAALEKIVQKLKNHQTRDEWLKQVADCYSTAAQLRDTTAADRLTTWKNFLAKEAPGNAIAGYFAFREMTADYSRKLDEISKSGKVDDMNKMQDQWKERLTKFVQEYPTCDDTPDALMQLGMVNEFLGKETEAKNWYGNLVKSFAKHPLAPKAEGAIRRLNIEGRELELTAQTIGSKAAFDIKSLKGKPVIVYYWASWNTQCAADFAKLKLIMSKYGSKLELVCVNLDNAEGEGIKYLSQLNVPGTHLYQQGGMDSPLAVHYGVTVLPNLFLVADNGKVQSRSVQVATLEDELKRLIKE